MQLSTALLLGGFTTIIIAVAWLAGPWGLLACGCTLTGAAILFDLE